MNPDDISAYLIQFFQDNIKIFIFLGLFFLVVYILRRLPDKANVKFWQAGIRAGKKVEEHRKDLADIIAQQSSRAQKAIAEQELRIQSINFDRDRVKHLIKPLPRLVNEVGQSLVAIELEYLKSLNVIKSDQAKEVLRLATQQRISSILASLDIPNNNNLPPFNIDEK